MQTDSEAWAEGTARPRIAIVADDDPDTRSLIARALEPMGFEVIEAADGVELLEQIDLLQCDTSPREPDLVVSDVQMPRCDGISAAIAVAHASPGVPVVLVTAFDDHGARAAALLAGVAALLPKPLDTRRLVTLVSGLLLARQADELVPDLCH